MFKNRSHKNELLDADEIPEKDLFQNLKELNFINHHLGGYRVTFSALNEIVKPGNTYVLVDIGSGGGDTLKRIHKWALKNAYHFNLYGIDIKPLCVHYALTRNAVEGINFICDDYKNIFDHVDRVDIIHAALFCHHLSEQNLLDLIRFSVSKGATLVINDLERNPIAYYAIKFLTRLFSASYLVKNDAPLSVLRGFKKKEWEAMLRKSGATSYSVKNKWAFRHRIIVHGNV